MGKTQKVAVEEFLDDEIGKEYVVELFGRIASIKHIFSEKTLNRPPWRATNSSTVAWTQICRLGLSFDFVNELIRLFSQLV